MDYQILDTFSDHVVGSMQCNFGRIKCYVKTQTKIFKELWVALQGKDLLCF